MDMKTELRGYWREIMAQRRFNKYKRNYNAVEKYLVSNKLTDTNKWKVGDESIFIECGFTDTEFFTALQMKDVEDRKCKMCLLYYNHRVVPKRCCQHVSCCNICLVKMPPKCAICQEKN